MELLLSDNQSIGFIGFGNMGSAIATAIHRSFPMLSIYVVESDTTRQDVIRAQFSFVSLVDHADLFQHCRVIFLSIKPQQVSQLSSDIISYVSDNHIFISMLAGVSTASISNLFATKCIRIMPNTPAKLSKGVTGIFSPPSVSSDDKDWVLSLCSSFGQIIELQNENEINLITAISGSGPAFYYRMVDAFITFASSHGLDQHIAKTAAIHTLLGAAEMLLDDANPKAQIKRVTSPNGTTQAGLEVMDNQNFDQLIESILARAYERAIELSKES